MPTPPPPADGSREASTQPQQAASLFSLRLLLLLCVVLPAGFFAVAAYFRLQQMRDEASVRLDRAVRIAQEHALKVLDTNEMLLARMLDLAGQEDDAALRSREPRLHAQLTAIVKDKVQFQSVWMLGADGRPIATSFRFPAPADTDFTDRDYFQWHRQKRGGTFITELLVGKATKTEFFDMSMGRYRADGSFAGVVTASLAPAYFRNFYSDLVADEPGLAITLFREDGAVYARWPPLPNAPPRLAPNSPVMTSIKQGTASGTTQGISSMDRRERLLMHRKIGQYPVYVGTGMDMGAIQDRWQQEMARLAAFAVPAVVGLFIAAYIAARRAREALAAAQRLEKEAVARRQVEQALLQAQKLEAMGRLTGGVAHDFNNALAVIVANLFLQRKKFPQTDDRYLASIGRAVDSATRLTRQLLAFSRNQPLVPEQVVLQQRLAAVEDLLSPVLGSRISLAVHIEPTVSAILVDPAELELALVNLAINARDAMPSGGEFSIDVSDAQGTLPTPLAGRFVVLEVRDTGTGIDPALLPKVFEPFFTTKPVGSGTGLGLSQVYGLAQRAGGTATIHSVPGAGTIVRLYFPAHTIVEHGKPPKPAEPQPELGKTVLLVEDNQDLAAAVRPMLETLGCQVTWLDRAEIARDWLARQSVLPDVVLTDVVMPGAMDGLALARHVRARYPSIAIVLMTGYAEQLDAIAQLGYPVLPKPSTAQAVAAAILAASSRNATT